MAFKYKKFNLNNAIKVKLNETGHKEMERQHYELYESIGKEAPEFKRKDIDENGYSTFQAHVFMNTFGHMMTLGGDLPFDNASILINELLLKDVE